ncbi:MFS transporter [Nocardiopsis suaedae]|uniref:MFS transporter n=1 Tax=Nocardiopsis suaedae TaxID=3018444 RepID=A0ABT4TJJ4_9ACTN|nr:MFS transporter [Nocardiopsis suaedae]MDA2804546.1 MFS transporter [Nocardiopsis suaedae]
MLGRLCSHSGNGAHGVAIAATVWQVSGGSGLALGLVPFAQFLPQLLIGAHAGALIDRWSRRRAMLLQQTVALGLAASMAVLVLSGAAELWSILFIVLGIGFSTSFSNPLQAAMVGELVTHGSARQAAVALNSASWQVGTLAGASLAGLAIPLIGPGAVMLISPTTYLISLASLLAIRASDLAQPRPRTRLEKVSLRALFAEPDLATSLLLASAVSLFGMGALQTGMQVLVVDTAQDLSEGTALGLASAAVALGGIAAQLYVLGSAIPTGRRLTGYATALGASLIASAFLPHFLLVLAGGCVAGWLTYSHQTSAQVINQRVPDHMKGQVAGAWFAASSTKAISAVIAGGLADLLGPRVGIVVLAGGLLTAAVASKRLQTRDGR